MADFAICQMMEQKRLDQLNHIPPVRLQLTSPYRNEFITGEFISSTGITKRQLDMRRKIEILKYQNTNGKISSKKQFSTLASASSSVSRRSSVNDCMNTPTRTSSSNIPGPIIELTYDETIPLYNYLPRPLAVGTLPNNDGELDFRFHKLQGQTIELDFVKRSTGIYDMQTPVTIGYLQIYESIPSSSTSFKLNATMTFTDMSSSIVIPRFEGTDYFKIFFSETEILQKKQVGTICVPDITSTTTLVTTNISQLPTTDGYIYKLQYLFTNFGTTFGYSSSTLKCIITDITVEITI